MANQYRYSQSSFRTSVITAVGLTAIVSFLVWLAARLFVLAHPNWITAVSAMVFFSFCSAIMIYRYLRNDVIVAIRPDGLFYAGHSSQAVPWDHIKDIHIDRQENEFQLQVHLWPMSEKSVRAFRIDLAPLDTSVETIVNALLPYARVSVAGG